MKEVKSRELLARARKRIPHGVGPTAQLSRRDERLFFTRCAGARVYDADGRELLSYAPLPVVGHAHPEILEVIWTVASDSNPPGVLTELEIRFAETMHAMVPSMERLRCVASGTEARLSAIRLARGFTGRAKVIRLDGGDCGHGDYPLVRDPSGGATLGLPDSSVTFGANHDTLIVPWGNLAPLCGVLALHAGRIAALLVEPFLSRVGVVPPPPGYLKEIRELASAEGALLIFDELATGFRATSGSLQARYGIRPDLTCIGLDGELSVACFGGRADVMENLAPLGPIHAAGAGATNLALAVGLKTLELLARPGVYDHLRTLSERFAEGLAEAARTAGVTVEIRRMGSMLTPFFTSAKVVDANTARGSDIESYDRFWRAMLERNIYLPPSQFAGACVSLVHHEADVEWTVRSAVDALREVAKNVSTSA